MAVMTRVGLAAVVFAIAACSGVTKNPDYCDENAPCKNGTFCNLDTHVCDVAIDAAPPLDQIEIDAPFVARTIPEVHASTTPDGTPVELEDVVVVAIDRYGQRVGEVWIQAEGGGPASGIRIFGAVTSEVASLAVGDVVDVTSARKVSYAPVSDTTGRYEIELIAVMNGVLRITKKARTATPVATLIDAQALALLSPSQLDAERDKLVGMLVRVSNVAATSDQVSVSVQPSDPTMFAFSVPAFDVESYLAAFPGDIQQNHCFSSITGLVAYIRGYHLFPPTTADLDDTGCL